MKDATITVRIPKKLKIELNTGFRKTPLILAIG